MAEMMRLPPGLLVDLDHGAAQFEGLRAAVKPRHRAAIERRQQGRGRRGDQVDQVIVERLFLGEGLALAHRGLGQGAVAAPLGGDAAQVGGGIVLDLLLHHRIHFAAHGHRMRRAGIGPRRHRRHIAGFQNEEARRGRASAAGSHVGDHRHRRGDDRLDGLAHGIHQSAGSIEADQQEIRVFLFGLRDRGAHDLGGNRMHHPIHVHRNNLGSRGQGLRGERQRDHRNYADSQSTHTIHYSRHVVVNLTMVIKLIQSFDGFAHSYRLE